MIFLQLLSLLSVAHLATANFVLNGDNSLNAKMRKKMNEIQAEERKKANLEIHENDYAELMRERRETLAINAAYAKRGSKFYPDGVTPIRGNEDIGVQIIDPRTPKTISNPGFTELRGTNTNEPELSEDVWKAIVKAGLATNIDWSAQQLNVDGMYEDPRYLEPVGGKLGPTLRGNLGLVHDGKPDPSKWSDHPRMKTYNANQENWIELDLGADHFVTNITLWSYYIATNRVYYKQKLEISEDGKYSPESEVWAADPGPAETSDGNTIVFDPPVRGRYIRNWRGGNSGNGNALFIEISINGYSAVPIPPPPSNTTQNGVVVEEIENIQQPGNFCKNPCDCLTSLRKELKEMCGDVCKQADLMSILQCSELKRKGKSLEKDMAAFEIMKAEEQQAAKTPGAARIKKAHPMGSDKGKPMFNMF